MNKYDFKKAKRVILENYESLDSAVIGMRQDWFWTAHEVYTVKEGFSEDLDEQTEINGLDGSPWAAPSLLLTHLDGRQEFVNIAVGGYVPGEPSEFFKECLTQGVLSSPCQEAINKIYVRPEDSKTTKGGHNGQRDNSQKNDGTPRNIQSIGGGPAQHLGISEDDSGAD